VRTEQPRLLASSLPRKRVGSSLDDRRSANVPHVAVASNGVARCMLAAQAAISLENTRLYSDLQEREAKVRRLVDSNIIGIYITDIEGRLFEANEAFLHMVGHSRDDLTSGRVRWTELTPSEWRDADEQAVAELRATGSCKVFEKEYFRKDGTRVPVLVGVASFVPWRFSDAGLMSACSVSSWPASENLHKSRRRASPL
jgi:PAS domain S-box-containing protein